jgi:threonine dehydratase
VSARLTAVILTSRVYDVAQETPLDAAPRLSQRLGNDVLLKREDLQPVFSFKLRGAYNRIVRLTGRARAGRDRRQRRQPRAGRGLRRATPRPARAHRDAADHARHQGRGRARPGRRCGAVRRHYADAKRTLRLDLVGHGRARSFIRSTTELVIAGQGTVGDEILRTAPGDVDAIFVPVGGGGLIAGIAPTSRPSGRRSRSSASSRSRPTRWRCRWPQGVAWCWIRWASSPTASPSARWASTRSHRAPTVDEIVRVSNDEICAAIKDVFDDTRSIMEPAGALAVAGLKTWAERRARPARGWWRCSAART